MKSDDAGRRKSQGNDMEMQVPCGVYSEVLTQGVPWAITTEIRGGAVVIDWTG
jgi:hypothetical protein